jgi:hypothetical protein
VGRNVIGYVNPPGGGEFRAAGRVDIKQRSATELEIRRFAITPLQVGQE